jgi:heat shock protein HslJ
MAGQKHFFRTLLILTALILPAACSRADLPAAPSQPSTSDEALTGSEWELTGLYGRLPLPGTRITLEFEPGELGGFAGCNYYGGAFSLSPVGSLAVEDVAFSAQACDAPQGVMEQEAAFIQALYAAQGLTFTPDELVLHDSSGQILMRFRRMQTFAIDPSRLAGTRWRLTAMSRSATLPKALLEGSTISLAFEDPGQLQGYSGCRRFRGTYQVDGDDFSLTGLEMLDTFCFHPEAFLQQEGEFTTALSETTGLRLEEGRLEMLTAGGGLLVFDALPEDRQLAGEPFIWELEAFLEDGERSPVLQGAAVTISFNNERVSGSAGCNRYQASFSFDGSSFSFSPAVSTRKACPQPEGLMEQEYRFLNILPEVTRVTIRGDELRLESEAGAALIFRPADLEVR